VALRSIKNIPDPPKVPIPIGLYNHSWTYNQLAVYEQVRKATEGTPQSFPENWEGAASQDFPNVETFKDCRPLAKGYGPSPSVDTVAEFLASPDITYASLNL